MRCSPNRLSSTTKQWRAQGGGDLEPVLKSGAVALIDAQWIIKHAEAGGVLTHRQAMPEEAFLSLADLVEATVHDLPVAALSYSWLARDHPDPDGANLRRVAKALKALTFGGRRLGVFWDYLSLHQHPDPANGVVRTDAENELFKRGLDCLSTLYAHQFTIVLRLTTSPPGHKKEVQPEGANVAEYFDRGWCFTENAMASLTKDGRLSLDLGLMHDDKEYDGFYCDLVGECIKGGGRRPPLLPSQFAAELEKKSFTNGKDDTPLVKRLYEAAFEEQFGKATVLDYHNLGWGDAEAAQLAEVLASVAAPRLERLDLSRNQIGSKGSKALIAALRKEGAAPHLESLALHSNQIGDKELKTLARVCEERGIWLNAYRPNGKPAASTESPHQRACLRRLPRPCHRASHRGAPQRRLLARPTVLRLSCPQRWMNQEGVVCVKLHQRCD